MMSGLVLVILAGLVALVLLMAYRMLTLMRSEPWPVSTAGPDHTGFHAHNPAQEAPSPTLPKPALKVSAAGRHSASTDRTELFTQLHILAGLQERDCRVKGLDLATAPEAVQGYATAWLYGAACALCQPAFRHTDALGGLVAHIASRKTGGRQPQALQAVGTLTHSTVLLACFRHGLEGAEFWQEHQHVPPRYSLYEAITTNAFI
jgi:hypothetical protein